MKKQGFVKGSAILVGMVVVTKALGLLYKVPLANILGGTGMGYFSAAFSVFTPIFALAAAGIPSAMARLAAENAALGRYANLRRQKRVAMVIYTAAGLAGCGGIVLLAQLGAGQPEVKWALMCLAPSVVFCCVMNTERGYHEGLGNMLPTAFSEIGETLLRLVLGLGLALYAKGLGEESFRAGKAVFGKICETQAEAEQAALPFVAAGAVLGSAAASGIACGVLLIVMKIRGDGISAKMLAEDPVTDSRRRHARALAGLSLSIALAAVVTTLTGMTDMLTIAPCLGRAIERYPQMYERYANIGKAELPNFLYGSYEGLAVMLYGLVPTVTAMLGKSALPPLTESIARGDECGAARGLRRLIKLSAMAAIPCGLGIAALSGELLRLLFAGRQAECMAAERPLAILGISVIFFGTALPCFTVVQALGKAGRVTLMLLTSGVIKLGLNLCLVPFMGLEGAALAELVSCIYVCIAALREADRLSGQGGGLWRAFVKPVYAGAMCAAAARLGCDFLLRLGVGGRAGTLLAVAFGGIVYGISVMLLEEGRPSALRRLDISG
ncbi:polysaccharide biosynthesis C-terminal domain-containing protein [Ruminococcus sp.]|uniref:oligosaccharide flippase family protein n=1 Tax=Ruminococcus sp. TaxID=41978 RepID=UPI0025F37560|nr:polysaccharide biosynthesis C-terminal domain-containing protein [Ruminococcus sp.]MBQ8965912.1 polysaccharide biosynthesis C-terminal domain-containing protein [Ruminococcus sp.]